MKARIALLLGWLAGATAGAVELPRGGTVTSGAAGIGGAGNTVNIDQSSDRAAIRWDSFNIGAGGVVNFHQPGAGSLTLNRVLDLNGSKIFGQLNANGRVFILNPNGVLFGPGARVNVGGLAASTKDLADGDFLAGDYRFTGGGSGEVVNQGILTASPGGFIALIGNRTVANYGTINAELGTAALAAGQTVRLNLTGDGLAGVEVDGGTLQAMVANRGAVMADGGRVYLTAKAADALVDTVVSNTGLIQARTLENRNGEIWLLGGQGENEGGTVEAAGRLDAGAPAGGDGGFIETSGTRLKIDPALEITTASAFGRTGTWLIDPGSFTIAESWTGDAANGMTAAGLATSLGSSNVVIQTTNANNDESPNIYIKDPVIWDAANTLTLWAGHQILVDAPVGGTATLGQLVFFKNANGSQTLSAVDPGSAAPGVIFKIGAENATTGALMVYNQAQLAAIGNDSHTLSYTYLQGGDINASGFLGRASANRFSGRYDGGNFTINNFAGAHPLFGNVHNADFLNIKLVNPSLKKLGITGQDYVYAGILAGEFTVDGGHSSLIRNISITGLTMNITASGGYSGYNAYSLDAGGMIGKITVSGSGTSLVEISGVSVSTSADGISVTRDSPFGGGYGDSYSGPNVGGVVGVLGISATTAGVILTDSPNLFSGTITTDGGGNAGGAVGMTYGAGNLALENIGVNDVSISETAEAAGGVIGKLDFSYGTGRTNFNNIQATGLDITANAQSASAGGLIGLVDDTINDGGEQILSISDVMVAGKLTAGGNQSSAAGGLIGKLNWNNSNNGGELNIERVLSYAEVSSPGSKGGIIGNLTPINGNDFSLDEVYYDAAENAPNRAVGNNQSAASGAKKDLSNPSETIANWSDWEENGWNLNESGPPSSLSSQSSAANGNETGNGSSEPPDTEPPDTEPPDTEPPGTEPPGTEPSGTEPPGTEPPGTEPSGTEPSGTEPPDLELPESGQSESEELPSELADNPNSTPEQPEILPPANNLGGADGREAGGSDSSLSELGESDSAGGDFANPGDGDGLRESGAESEAAPAESDRGGNDQAIATENGGDAAADFFDWSRPDGENPVSVDDLGLGEDFLSWAEAGESAMDFDFWSETADGQGERDRIPGLDGLAAEVADTREIFSLLSGLLSELDSRLPGLSPEEHDSFRPLRDKLALSGKARLGEMAGLLRNLSVQLRFRRENPDLNPVLVESLIISLVDRIENTVERLWLDTMRAAALAYAAGEEGGKTPAKAFDLMEKGTLAMRGNLAEYRRRLDGFAKWQRRNRVTYREQ